MNKATLIKEVAEKAGLSKKDAAKAVAAFQETVKETLAAGEKVQLVGFGTFSVADRKERNGVNPKTQEAIVIPAKKAPKFKAGKSLKEVTRG